jgi:hypothetical protein
MAAKKSELPSPGRRVDLLVCGEMLSGTATAETVYVHVDVHTVGAGTIHDGDVRVWNGKRFAPTTKSIQVVDLRPPIAFNPRSVINQYEVWEPHKGKPRSVRVESAIGLSRVKVRGQWSDRSEWFNTQQECQAAIDAHKKNRSVVSVGVDPMFVPAVED